MRDSHGNVTRERTGAFVRDRFGRLKDDSGRMLLGLHGALNVPAGATIESDGSIRKEGHVLDAVPLENGASLHSGFLEASNVNAISEMVDVLCAQRSFESAQKVLSAIDATRQKSGDELARLK